MARLYCYFLKAHNGVNVTGSVNVIGKPVINIKNGGEIVVGDNVTLRSSGRGYHAFLPNPVKLSADKYGACIYIGDNTRINGACLHACHSIHVGRNCLIAANCQIMDSNGHDLSFDNVADRINTTGQAESVVIEDNVWLGISVIVLPGVTIGQGAIVGAGSVVTKDIPPMSIAVGVPAQVVKLYSE